MDLNRIGIAHGRCIFGGDKHCFFDLEIGDSSGLMARVHMVTLTIKQT